MQTTVQRMRTSNAAVVHQLAKQLGCALTVDQTARHIETTLAKKDHALSVPTKDENTRGQVHAFQTAFIESLTFLEVGGFVVDEICRAEVVGRLLMI